jgi:hypothetical protein
MKKVSTPNHTEQKFSMLHFPYYMLLLLAATITFFAGCDRKETSISEKTLTSLSVTTQPMKKDYIVNEAFDPAAMVVIATYSDKSTTPITVTKDMLDYDFSTSGTKTVTINYVGKTAAVTGITVVDKVVLSIAITAPPTKMSYMTGEIFDTTGMVVTATYNDNTKVALIITPTMLSYDFSTAGTKTVTVTYMDKTAAVTGITVIQRVVVSIAVTTDPLKKEYIEGQPFDPAGMVVTGTYNDNSTAPVTITAAMFTYDFSNAGTGKTVLITYESGITATVTNITVIPRVVASIAVTTPPTKMIYNMGDVFDPTGMIVTATYNDNSTVTVPNTALTFSYDFYTSGTKTVTVTYQPSITTAITNVTVNAVTTPVTQLVGKTNQPTLAAADAGNLYQFTTSATDEYTIICKIKLTSKPGGSSHTVLISDASHAYSAVKGWNFMVTGATDLNHYRYVMGDGTLRYIGGGAAELSGPLNTWETVALRIYNVNGTRWARMYTNGVKGDSISMTGWGTATATFYPLMVGNSSTSVGSNNFYISQLGIWNTALPEQYILNYACMKGNIPDDDPYRTNLIGYWPMDEETGTVFKNRSAIGTGKDLIMPTDKARLLDVLPICQMTK